MSPDLVPVRLRPGMYIGDTRDGSGLVHMCLEIIGNAVDAVINIDNPCVNISSLAPVIVQDNGAGMRFDEEYLNTGKSKATHNLEVLHFSGSADKHAPHVHLSTVWGVGVAVVNALSSRLEVESWRNNDCWHCVYERGEAKLQPRIISRGKGNGTKVTFWPDPDIFDSIEVDTLKLRETIQHAAYLFPGIKYKFLGEEFFSEKGLSDLIEVLEPGIDVRFSVNDTFGKLKLNVALGGQAKENATQWHSWSNGVQMREHGSHLEGVKKALDGLGFNPAIGLIHVVFHDPKYAGPTKGELLAPEIVDLIANELAPLLKTVKTIGQ